MAETTRKRSLPFNGPASGSKIVKSKSPNGPTIRSSMNLASALGDCNGTQVTVSSGHPFTRRNSKTHRGQDVGGPFFSQRKFLKSGIEKCVLHGEDQSWTCILNGSTFVCAPTWAGKLSFPDYIAISSNELDALGTTAIARCKPTNSVADLSVAIGEILKEGIPSIIGSRTWQDRALTAKNAGSEYLNVAFGWQPLVRDISKFAKGVVSLESVMRQYERDAGRVVRRRFNFPVSTSTVVENFGAIGRQMTCPTESIFNDGGFGTQAVRIRETVRSTWFSGAFTYSLPSGYDARTTLGRYALIADRLGLELTPRTLWELAPWSWAIDWFSNTGDVVSNLSDFVTGGLVMRYGYVMDHTITTDTYVRPGGTGLKANVPVAPPMVLVSETKIRRQAHPFGFGVSWDGLSSFQLSILAALGMSRR